MVQESLGVTLYDRVKDAVSAEAAATKYAGVQPVQRGQRSWACCPLHGEKTPSMMFDRKGRFHCFGCGVGGSSIDFLADYYHIPASEAVKRLAEDYGLEGGLLQILPDLRAKRQKALEIESFNRCLQYCENAVNAAIRYWRAVKFEFSPAAMSGEFTDLFAEACRKLPELEDLADQLLYGTIDQRAQIMLKSRTSFEHWHMQFVPGGEAWDFAMQLCEDGGAHEQRA